MIPSHLKLATLGFQFNLSRANRLIELARSQDEDLRSEILRGTIIVLASAIDTLFRTVILEEAVFQYSQKSFATNDLRLHRTLS